MTLEELDVLSQSPVFKGISIDQISSIIVDTVYRIKNFNKGDSIAQSGSSCNNAIVILSGSVSGEMMDLSGKVLKIEDMEPSKMIAPAFLYGNNKKFPVNVIANESVKIWEMHRDEFSKLLQKELILLDNFLNAISNQAQFLSDKIRFLSFPTLRSKLAYFFLRNSTVNDFVKIPMTHQQLSELFGVARPSLSREIRLLNNEGLIKSDRDLVKILDLPGLKAHLTKN